MAKAVNIVERIERSLPRMTDGECWEPDKTPANTGYHRFTDSDNRSRAAHRLAWEMHNAEPIPDGMVVMHTCDNPRCINPEHLVLGTLSDNTRDAVAKGRWTQAGVPPESRTGRVGAPRDSKGRFIS